MRTLPIARSTPGAAASASRSDPVGEAVLPFGVSPSTSGTLVRPTATLGLATLEDIEPSDERRILRLSGAPLMANDWHRPRRRRRWALCGVMRAEDARGVCESQKDSGVGTAAALPSVPRWLQRTLRRGAAAAGGNGQGARPARHRGR